MGTMTRREFLKAAGMGVAAVSVAQMLGGFAGFAENASAANAEDAPLSRTDVDVLVIGGGYAGTFAAVAAKAKGLHVVLIDKGSVGRSGMTPWANGFNVFDEADGDSREDMISGTSVASEYLNNRDWLELQFEDSKKRWDELVSWGALDTRLRHPHLVLRDKLVESGVQLMERTMVTELLTKNGAVVGAIGFSLDDEKAVAVLAKATVMCTGAGSFKASGFPIQGLTSDGDAMAYRAGATISGKEFVDFHWTSAETPADCWNQWAGMWASGISQTHGAFGGGMLLSRLSARIQGRMRRAPARVAVPLQVVVLLRVAVLLGGGPPPGAEAGGAAAGPPGSSSGPQVLGAATGMGIHKAEGVWPADMTGFSGLAGLWAAGDSLASMLCGASYAGVGLSSSGSAVQGARAGEAAAAYVAHGGGAISHRRWWKRLAKPCWHHAIGRTASHRVWVTQVLQNTMFPYYVLFVKKADRLEAALWPRSCSCREHMVPCLRPPTPTSCDWPTRPATCSQRRDETARISLPHREPGHPLSGGLSGSRRRQLAGLGTAKTGRGRDDAAEQSGGAPRLATGREHSLHRPLYIGASRRAGVSWYRVRKEARWQSSKSILAGVSGAIRASLPAQPMCFVLTKAANGRSPSIRARARSVTSARTTARSERLR